MDGLVLLNGDMSPIQYISVAEGDFNIGDTFDFELKVPDTLTIQQGYYVALENSEFGGIVDKVKRDTGKRYITIGGRTWQGMLQETYNTIYYSTSGGGDLINCTKFLVDNRISDLFKYGEPCPISENSIVFRSGIYTLSAIREVYRRFDKRFHIIFDPSINRPVIQAVTRTHYDDPLKIKNTLNYSWQVSNCPNFAICQMKSKDIYAYLNWKTGEVSRSDYRSGKNIRSIIKEASGEDEDENYQALFDALLEQYEGTKTIELYDIDAETFYLDDLITFTAGDDRVTATISSKSAIIQDGYIKYEVSAS